MTRFYDGVRLAEISMVEYRRDSGMGPDMSADYFEVGSLAWDPERGAYVVQDVEYLADMAQEWQAGDGLPEDAERLAFVQLEEV